MSTGLLRGVWAGAAATTTLNATTYLDMAVRGRPTSSAPQQLVERTADDVGLTIPGKGEVRNNRVEGLAPLAGTAVGLAVGAITGVVHRFLERHGRSVPALVAVPLIGGVAMALSDVPLTLLGISDARTWSAKDWASDVVPHLVYGATVYAALHTTDS